MSVCGGLGGMGGAGVGEGGEVVGGSGRCGSSPGDEYGRVRL